jgi:type I restriction enzyme S subunit
MNDELGMMNAECATKDNSAFSTHNSALNIPAIRFKGFSGEWEKIELRDVSTYLNGGSFENDVQEKGRYELITLKSINMQGKLVSSDRYIDIETPTLKKDTLVMILSEQSPGLLGMTAQIPIDNRYVLNQRVAEIRPTKNIVSYFLSMAINKNQHYFSRCGAGTKVQNISKPNVEGYEFSCPRKTEQTKIGNYFQQLDTLIAQHQQKHDKLLNLKKALLELMFPKQGASVPEIRFKGFSGEWEERNLDDVSIVSTGFPFDSNNFDARGEYLVVTNGNIQDDLPIVDASIGNRVNIEKNSKLNEYVLNAGDILVTMDGTVGRVAKVLNKKQILAQRVGRITAKFDPEFLYQLLCRVDFFKTMTLISHGGTIKHISLSEIGCYKSFFSESIEEQTKVGDFFKNLDTLLNQHQAQLKKLNNIKQACLEKMFV